MNMDVVMTLLMTHPSYLVPMPFCIVLFNFKRSEYQKLKHNTYRHSTCQYMRDTISPSLDLSYEPNRVF